MSDQHQSARDPWVDLMATLRTLRHGTPGGPPEKVEMSERTLQALREAALTPRQTAFGLATLWSGSPVFVVDDVPDGKARITYPGGLVEVIP